MLQSLNWQFALLAFAFGYLLGSIPFGVVVTRLAGAQDVRSIGSGNIGATNVLRSGRKGLAAATLLGDALKATAAVVVAAHYEESLALVAALGAFLGHLFPVWLGFKGGKGVATYIGALIGFVCTAGAWPALVAFIAAWALVAALTRYSSLSGLIASAVTPVVLFMTGATMEAQLFVLLTALLWLRHWGNIVRLLNGTEGKIGQRSAASPGT